MLAGLHDGFSEVVVKGSSGGTDEGRGVVRADECEFAVVTCPETEQGEGNSSM